jgi:cell division septal protein FtsQ
MSIIAAVSLWHVGRAALLSELFLLQEIEVVDVGEGSSPLDAQSIMDLAALPVGGENLFLLDLKGAEIRLSAHPWMKRVILSKRFPQTVVIRVEFREPVAILQDEKGRMSYLDREGVRFEHAQGLQTPDLPLVLVKTGASPHGAIQLLRVWQQSEMEPYAQIASVTVEPESGLRAWILYPMGDQVGRTQVQLGNMSQEYATGTLQKLKEVLAYLSERKIYARQLLADTGKKIVVKTDRRS